MKRKILFVVALLCFVLLLACGCNKSEEIVKAQQAAVEKATSLVCQAVVTDGEATVYAYSRETVVVDDGIAVTTSESKLNSSFELEEKSSTQQGALDRSQFAVLALSGKIDNVQKQNGVITGTISNENLSVALGSNVQSADGATVTAEISDGILTKLTVSFSTVSNKSVTLTYSYGF